MLSLNFVEQLQVFGAEFICTELDCFQDIDQAVDLAFQQIKLVDHHYFRIVDDTIPGFETSLLVSQYVVGF
jgi:hypothetical protein